MKKPQVLNSNLVPGLSDVAKRRNRRMKASQVTPKMKRKSQK